MILVGEKLNSSIPRTLQALTACDEAYVTRIIKQQAKAGADFIDINTALTGAEETKTMRWLDGLVSAHSGCGVMIDSPNAEVIIECLTQTQNTRIIVNSVTLDDKYEALIHAAAAKGAGLVCLPMDGALVPETADDRMDNAAKLISKLTRAGIPEAHIYIDVLIESVATNGQAVVTALSTIQKMRDRFPTVKTICGLSNVSFGLPDRATLNAAFLTMAVTYGLSAAILNVMNEDLQNARAAAEALLGMDEYCMGYIGFKRK